MSLDFFIFCLLVISFAINLLALSAFYMTPGLRTTAGRFVINLLIINLVGCCILASTLLFIENTSATEKAQNNDCNLKIIPYESKSDHPRLTSHRNRMIQENVVKIEQFASIFENDSDIEFESEASEEGDEEIVVIRGAYDNLTSVMDRSDETENVKHSHVVRVWSIDLAAALGGLSVLVVVGDTWMAVRDPLRYHGRVSKGKAWLLIASNWTLGIIFGVMSAYWQFDSEVIGNIRNNLPHQIQVLSLILNIIFSKTFAYFYFVVIILLPFGFVCGMYWRIFSEAKENNQRMCNIQVARPLLKSSSQDIIESDQIYSTPHLKKCNMGHWNFLTGFESTTNLRYIAYQALQIRDTHTFKSSEAYLTSVAHHESSFLKHRKQSRAARISIFVVVMFLVSYLPYGFLALLQGSQIIMNFPCSTQLAIFLILQANLCSPFIFAYRNKRVRHSISRFFGFNPGSRKHHHRQQNSEFLRFITRVSIRIKRDSRKLTEISMNSCKYQRGITENAREIVKTGKFDVNNVATYFTNSAAASIQSGILFGNIGVFNSVDSSGYSIRIGE